MILELPPKLMHKYWTYKSIKLIIILTLRLHNAQTLDHIDSSTFFITYTFIFVV